MRFTLGRLLPPALTVLAVSGAVADDAQSRAENALDVLQEWYDNSTGLRDTAGWWNGANCMTAVADLAAVDSSVRDTASYVFQTTYSKAPASNPHPGPETKTTSKRRHLLGRASPAVNASAWLDSAYDDDGWWALAWIAAYDVTHEQSYLDLAEGIFAALLPGARSVAVGSSGIPPAPYVNAITNELFLSVAAHLANRVPSRKAFYVDWAQKEWEWFQAQGFIGENGTINDGLLDNCQNNGDTLVLQSRVVLGGLVELNKAAPNDTYLPSAERIAKAAIETLADSDKVIHDSCEPSNCEPNATQFKGIFIRNLQMLYSVAPDDLYKQVIISCADHIWTKDRNNQGQLGVVWSGPLNGPIDATTQSSALDALIAAITI
ncbi:hypothetical protein N7470_007225 [Penicillium chermesinum]|nr:hypothetical protein N7470_007225 [Penicillium chermesinum]